MRRISRRSWWVELPPGRTRRPPWPVTGRGLGTGILLGVLLGAGLQASDVNYRSWIAVGFAAVVGAAVALPPAAAAVFVCQVVGVKSLRLAWLACSAAAAAAIVIMAAVFDLLAAPATLVVALFVFAVVFATSRFITTQRSDVGQREDLPDVVAR